MKYSICIFLLFILGLGAVCQAASIGNPTISPASVPSGVPAIITVSTVVLDSAVIPSSINLQQVDAQGRVVKVIGNLADNGMNGDVAAGDNIFTIQFPMLQQAPATLTYRISAGVSGSVLRIFSAPMNFSITGGVPTGISIAQPSNLSFTNVSPITISGVAGDPGATVQVNGITAVKSGNSFQASIPLQEGNNPVTAVATNTNGTVSTAAIQVILDTTPPHVTVDSPSDGFVTTDANLTVSGIVNDLVVGTVNDQQAKVTVNGTAAQVVNRRYVAQNLALSLGANTIQVVGRDRTGNSATATVKVTRQAPAQLAIRLISGNNQTGVVAKALAQPLVVQLVNGNAPVPNMPVIFKVTENDGALTAGNGTQNLIVVKTDSQGQARSTFTLGHRYGAGNNIVQAYAAGFEGVAVFTESGTPQPAAKIVVDSGDNQFGPVGAPLSFPFIAVVVDDAKNRLSGVPVTFTVAQGGGTIGGQSTVQTVTDGDGRALALLTLGPGSGQDNNIVQATFAGNPGAPATFTASAKNPGNPAQTTVSGIVVDNSDNPIPGVTMRLFRPNQGANNNQPVPVGTPVTTDAHGFFHIAPAPVGLFKLMADGSTTSQQNKAYPTLEYDIVTIAGQDNGVGTPIYLPTLDPAGRLCVNATTGGELTPAVSPGFSLKIQPGAATFPGGSKSGCVSVSPVNPDKMPMMPAFGQQPRFVVTIQPVGTTFNPPAAVTVPNLEGLTPNSKTEMFSYDHDLSTFVSIGSATVSKDGSVIASDPGVGVLKAGWFDSGPPPGSTFTLDPISVKVEISKQSCTGFSSPQAVKPADTSGATCPSNPDLFGVPESPILLALGDAKPVQAFGTVKGTYTWTSSDPSILRIINLPIPQVVGVEALKPGKATITVRLTADAADTSGKHHFASEEIDIVAFEIQNLKISPDGDRSILKTDRNATEIATPVTATFTLNTGSFVGGNDGLEVPIVFSFQDPDDTDDSLVVDPNGILGNDNAPIENGGKRGDGSVMWAALPNTQTIFAPDGQKVEVLVGVRPGETASATVNFLSSSIAGDNYIIKAQVGDNPLPNEMVTSGIWSVVKPLEFSSVAQMAGGPDLASVMSQSVVNPAFFPRGYTNYSLGPVKFLPASQSPEFLVDIQPPNPDELPTATELQQLASTDSTAKASAQASINAKALKWAQRVSALNVETGRISIDSFLNTIGVTVPGIVGIRAFSNKEDGDPTTGKTGFYPPGTLIPFGPFGPDGKKALIDPDGEWDTIQGMELGPDKRIILLNARGLDPALQVVSIRRLVAFASDHVPFGPLDLSATGLMTPFPTPSDLEFSDDAVLRLRGWQITQQAPTKNSKEKSK